MTFRDFKKMVTQVNRLFVIEEFRLHLTEALMPGNDYLITGDPIEISHFEECKIILQKDLEEVKKVLDADEQAIFQKIEGMVAAVFTHAHQILAIKDIRNSNGGELMEKMDHVADEAAGLATQLIIHVKNEMTEAQESAKKSGGFMARVTTGIGIVSVFLGIGLTILVARQVGNIVDVIGKSIESLTKGASRVFKVSEHVMTTAQSLAQGAAQQASNMEVVSGVMVQMASATRQNAENADVADTMMDKANFFL